MSKLEENRSFFLGYQLSHHIQPETRFLVLMQAFAEIYSCLYNHRFHLSVADELSILVGALEGTNASASSCHTHIHTQTHTHTNKHTVSLSICLSRSQPPPPPHTHTTSESLRPLKTHMHMPNWFSSLPHFLLLSFVSFWTDGGDNNHRFWFFGYFCCLNDWSGRSLGQGV